MANTEPADVALLVEHEASHKVDALTNAVSWLAQGGPVVGVLIALSVVAATVIIVKAWQRLWLRDPRRDVLDGALDTWRGGDQAAALARLSGCRSPAARVVRSAMRTASRGLQTALVREEALRVAALELASLRSHLRTLEVIGMLSPLLGLLGTVMGMITAFQQLASAGSQVDPAMLSGGIWEALLTTAVGLIVAIPVVASVHVFERGVERQQLAIEDALTRLFTGGAGEGEATVDVRPAGDALLAPATS